MKAARFHAQEDIRIEEVGEPSPGRGKVKLRNAYAGICGSDLHVYYSPEASRLDFTKPHPVTGSMPPQILGHEFSCTVVELGEGIDRYSVGDRVAVWPIHYCGTCMTFRSTSVRVQGKAIRLVGDLTIRDKTKSVVLDGTYEGRFKDPWGKMRTAFIASTTINRQDFGVSFNGPFEQIGQIGDDVAIEIAIEAVQQ